MSTDNWIMEGDIITNVAFNDAGGWAQSQQFQVIEVGTNDALMEVCTELQVHDHSPNAPSAWEFVGNDQVIVPFAFIWGEDMTMSIDPFSEGVAANG